MKSILTILAVVAISGSAFAGGKECAAACDKAKVVAECSKSKAECTKTKAECSKNAATCTKAHAKKVLLSPRQKV